MRCRALLLSGWLLVLPGCSAWWFSGESWIDRSRPVALIETTGGVEFGATTELGVLSLGRTATEGPCRVRYFLGPTPMIETGELQPVTATFAEARIDLKTQFARVLDRAPTADDTLCVMWTPRGERTERIFVDVARGQTISGDLLVDPGIELPAGATLLCRGPKGEALFAGLIAGRLNVPNGPDAGRYYVVAGVDRVRELLAVPRQWPIDLAPQYRPDGITVLKPSTAEPTPPTEGQATDEPSTDDGN